MMIREHMLMPLLLITLRHATLPCYADAAAYYGAAARRYIRGYC